MLEIQEAMQWGALWIEAHELGPNQGRYFLMLLRTSLG